MLLIIFNNWLCYENRLVCIILRTIAIAFWLKERLNQVMLNINIIYNMLFDVNSKYSNSDFGNQPPSDSNPSSPNSRPLLP